MKRVILTSVAVAALATAVVANWPRSSTADTSARWGGSGDHGVLSAAMHRGGRGGFGRGFGRGMGGPYARLLRDDRLADQLKLTTAQRSRLRLIADEHRRLAVQMRADAELARLDLGKLMREDRPDRNRIEAQIDAVTKLRAEQMKSAIGAGLDAREALTAEQRKQLEAMRDSWRGEHRGLRDGKGHRQGGRGPGARGTQGSGTPERGGDAGPSGTSTES
jgi:Spy/CpxP family protein refolding chaperone